METSSTEKALVIFSGGQDSTTCLGWAKNRYKEVETISFLYGQNHQIEIEQAKKIAGQLQIPHHIFDVSFFSQFVKSALISQGDVNQQHEDHPDLPASFVPNRNAFFITLAHSYAQTIKASALITGVCQTDYSGYPDCREDFVRKLKEALNLGSDQNIKVITPLMHLNKAETFLLAEREAVLDLVVKESHTCYEDSEDFNYWGRGCGKCPACNLREKGFVQYLKLKEENG